MNETSAPVSKIKEVGRGTSSARFAEFALFLENGPGLGRDEDDEEAVGGGLGRSPEGTKGLLLMRLDRLISFMLVVWARRSLR